MIENNSNELFNILHDSRNFPFDVFGKTLYLALLDENGIEVKCSSYNRVKIHQKEFNNGSNIVDIHFNEAESDWGIITYLALYNKNDKLIHIKKFDIPKFVSQNSKIWFFKNNIKIEMNNE